MGDPKTTIHGLLCDYYKNKGVAPTLQVARALLKKPVTDNSGKVDVKTNAIFNGEVCETVLEIMIKDFRSRNPKRTEDWYYCKSVILSDLESRSSKFLTEIDAVLLTPECIYVFECKSYSGDKELVGSGTIVRKNNSFDVFKQNLLHLKILSQWVGKLSKHPVFQMVLFDFSNGTMIDKRTTEVKQRFIYASEKNIFDILREVRLITWKPETLKLIHDQFARETELLHARHLDYVTHLKH